MFIGFLCLSFALHGLLSADQQSVSVTGIVLCEGKPYADARIKLYDVDKWTLDDKLAEVKTDNNGKFTVEGTGNEKGTMKTKFNIYHRCGMKTKICYYKNSFEIPQSYVTSGPKAGQTYNVKNIDLSTLEHNRDCFN